MKKKRKKSRRKKRVLFLLAEIVILAVLLAVGYVILKYDKFQVTSFDEGDIKVNEGANQEGYTTVALFGGDSREGQLEEGTHADCIIVATIDNQTKEVKMVSVYRDTLTEQMNGEIKKANNAYFTGGPQDAINMLNKNLDLNIEDYATVDFKAMADVVDLIGGIEIDVTDAEADMLNEYIGETAKVAKKEAHTLNGGGTYNLDGPQAVTYARLRKLEGGDYKRTERQRLVIQKIFEKAVKMDVGTLNKLVDTVFPQVSTSFTLKEIVNLGSAGITYKLSDSTGFPFDRDDSKRYKGTSVVVAQGLAENVQQLHEFLYPSETEYTVSDIVQSISDDIMNTTGVTRPKELDEEKTEGEETSDTSVGEEMTSEEVDSEEQ